MCVSMQSGGPTLKQAASFIGQSNFFFFFSKNAITKAEAIHTDMIAYWKGAFFETSFKRQTERNPASQRGRVRGRSGCKWRSRVRGFCQECVAEGGRDIQSGRQ